MKRTALIVVVLGAALAGYLYWASDERQIRRLLDGVAAAVTQEEGAGGVAGLAEVAGLTRYLAPDVTFEPGAPFRAITGAQDIVSTVGRLRAVMATVELTFSDIEVAVDGGTASVRTTARLTLRDRDGAQSVETRNAQIALEERDAGWVITTARAESR
ncbi:MAG TPA: nuclear transport factor 2 family protein [Vicinamibacterales bacterium]|nr:nuclear transport factor 2 family protein [Vicinamibacterales bacterium]